MKTTWIGLAAALLVALAPPVPIQAQAKRTIRIVATS
jgi:hypothetical protein